MCGNIMKEKNRHRRTALMCFGITFSGLAVIVFGIIRIVKFVNRIPQRETMTTSRLVHELILPHIILLCGMGLLAGGIILMIRHSVIQERLRHGSI